MGAFGGFLGGIGNGVQQQQQQDGVGPSGQKPQQGGIPGGGAGAFGLGGQWGILPIIKNALSGGSGGGAQAAPAPAAAPTAAIPAPNSGQPAHAKMFQGLLPMAQGYYANHQAKVQDAAAQPHISSLQDPTITPEQQQYHLNNLQTIYAGRPEMLKKYGLQPPTATPVSLGQPQGAANSYTPTAQPVNLGQDRTRTSMTVTSPGAGMGSLATEQ